jgi:ubiquinone/menaquinone biosynthesis C-methylase UbiE
MSGVTGAAPDPEGDAEGEAMRAYYASRAPAYDAIYAKPERQDELRELERWLPWALAGRPLLDVACGTGHWTRFLAPAVPSLLGVDAAPETLAIARARVPAPHVAFAVGDAYDLAPLGRRFHGAFAGFWFSHVPAARRQAFLRGLHAVLEPDASVVLLDNRYVEGSSTPVAERDAAGDAWQLRPLADGSTHRVLKNFPDEAELRAAADAAGGRAVAVTLWRHFWALAYRVP